MEHADVSIIKMLQELEKSEEQHVITEGPVKIGNQEYMFEQTFFFDQKLAIHIPRHFVDMDEKSKKIKYPHEQRPQIIKTNAAGSVDITLSLLDEDLDDPWVKELTEGMRDVVKKMNPSNVFYQTNVETVNDRKIGYFDFKSPALDGFLYNIMFFLALDGKAVMGTFCCSYKDIADWRDAAMQVIKSVIVIKSNEDGVEA